MNNIVVERKTSARIPTEMGEFQLCYYKNSIDEKEHLALLFGNVVSNAATLVRVHSECFTGDVLGSLRCDCGPQLKQAMQEIAAAGAGIIVYLRQEGRGIGLLDKLRAYNLQDEGYDTVEANLILGHQPDGRDYIIAAHILRDLGVGKVRLLTNNPSKIEGLEQLGIPVVERVPLPPALNVENETYLATKVERMRHLLNLNGRSHPTSPQSNGVKKGLANGRPLVTLSYAQSLDGSITKQRGQPLALSGQESMTLTHQLRASHDAILVGIGTVLADDPRLTVRLVSGTDPQPIIVDSQLRLPLNARLLNDHPRKPMIATTEASDPQKEAALIAAGATVLRLPATASRQVSLPALLQNLGKLGIKSLMVEGGAAIITSFLAARLVERLVITVAPLLVGGLNAVGNLNGHGIPQLKNTHSQWLGKDMVLSGDVSWQDGI
ncbi:3,4-dihydroxy-2-butanone 4-phosphate synthase / GTP cyclohydrolase II [hydrothermal vent metagenome]|uniref:GTP cyclohydrolase II n=2 Tax=hydrothermal vent metagenome TaxID=652676 RepID=A0A3B0UX02_9ZZZZ